MTRERTSRVGGKNNRIRKSDLRHRFRFSSFGVGIEIASNESGAIDAVRRRLKREFPGQIRGMAADARPEQRFDLVWNRSAKDTVRRNNVTLTSRMDRRIALSVLISEIRITVAEYSPNFVFVHAAVVCVGDRALLIPGSSLSGKTTLAAALVRAGASYCSDEYAVFDEKGKVHRFPRPLSFRDPEDRYRRFERDYEEIGGVLGPERSEAAGVIVTEFKDGAEFEPATISRGEGLMELMKHAVPLRRSPGFVLDVLAKASEKVVFLRSKRGDADETANRILGYFVSIAKPQVLAGTRSGRTPE